MLFLGVKLIDPNVTIKGAKARKPTYSILSSYTEGTLFLEFNTKVKLGEQLI